VLRSIRVQSSDWVARVYPVDTTLQCAIAPTSEGPRHTVVKRVSEDDFVQNDTLILWPDSGRAVWYEAIAHTCTTSSLPRGTRDIVSFFFDLRDVIGQGVVQTGGLYRLAMDGQAHELDIHAGLTERRETPFGTLEAVALRLVSRSPTLFVRNRPRQIWISPDPPAVLQADVRITIGTVRARLISWERDGLPVTWDGGAP
jgi:hypothetical protein